ncbi:hypothetical protein OIE67_25690 [Nonomuraea fuscirosea]|uniref:hypothetical protein n=1 Tax=Nonomuraea fuscirosea TaxID=1291556 RepID=UPI002DDA058D|nr:hypothetical protein [Nonomuraea fuscirosea]WSA57889.1 hypothetical protein OIE67_25690 [Nonomuraea fuscirosea]
MKTLAVSAVVVLVLAAVTVLVIVLLPDTAATPRPSTSAAPATQTVSGSVLVRGSSPQVLTENELACTTGGGYDDIRQGAQVVVTDAAGKTIALGQLGAGGWKRDVGCSFLFTVPEVPAGEKFYGIEVSHRGRVQYTAEQMTTPIELSIG